VTLDSSGLASENSPQSPEPRVRQRTVFSRIRRYFRKRRENIRLMAVRLGVFLLLLTLFCLVVLLLLSRQTAPSDQGLLRSGGEGVLSACANNAPVPLAWLHSLQASLT
jgi:hypothetical protein